MEGGGHSKHKPWESTHLQENIEALATEKRMAKRRAWSSTFSSSLFFLLTQTPERLYPTGRKLASSYRCWAALRSSQLRKEAAIFHLGHQVAPNHKHNAKENWQEMDLESP